MFHCCCFRPGQALVCAVNLHINWSRDSRVSVEGTIRQWSISSAAGAESTAPPDDCLTTRMQESWSLNRETPNVPPKLIRLCQVCKLSGYFQSHLWLESEVLERPCRGRFLARDSRGKPSFGVTQLCTDGCGVKFDFDPQALSILVSCAGPDAFLQMRLLRLL